MIANTSSGKRFGPLASYLVSGRSGTETERVAWTAGRNLGTDDPALAAPLMQATARQSALVQTPVYHLTVSFNHEDRVTPAQMQSVADRVLRDLGLAEHQAMMVAHRDRAHAHVHVMVNRVHPDTGVAWERWKDRPKIERALRDEERALGLREVPGRLHATDREPSRTRYAERIADPGFADRLRSIAPELRASRTWDDLAANLAAHGLRVEGKGQGLVFTDGEHEVKASRVGRDLSLRRLEERFGMPYPRREEMHGAPIRPLAELSPAAIDVAAMAREHERIDALARVRLQLDQERYLLQARRTGFDNALDSIRKASREFDRSLSYVYREPEGARERIRAAASEVGPEAMNGLLAQEPERFGALRTEEKSRAFGLFSVEDDTKARSGARLVAEEWTVVTRADREAVELSSRYVRDAEANFDAALHQIFRNPSAARTAFELAVSNAGLDEAVRVMLQSPDRLGALRTPGTLPDVARIEWESLGDRARSAVEARAITSTELAKAHADQAIHRLSDRARGYQKSLDEAPSVDLLRRGIARAVDRLEPAEIMRLRRVLTTPQAAVVFKAGQAVRDMVLGQSEQER